MQTLVLAFVKTTFTVPAGLTLLKIGAFIFAASLAALLLTRGPTITIFGKTQKLGSATIALIVLVIGGWILTLVGIAQLVFPNLLS